MTASFFSERVDSILDEPTIRLYSSVYKILRTAAEGTDSLALAIVLTYIVGQKVIAISKPGIAIRDLDSVADLQLAMELEREVWESADADVTSLTLAVATRAVGAIWLGAFNGPQLIGFAFALPSIEHGGLGFHSHMLGVRSSSSGRGNRPRAQNGAARPSARPWRENYDVDVRPFARVQCAFQLQQTGCDIE